MAKPAFQIAGVAISHPDKPLWPAAANAPAITKRDLAEYLAAVGPWMLPHVKGRPCSLLRAPDGVGKERFLQRHKMAGASSLIRDAPLASDDGAPYMQFDTVAALVAGAQIGGVELHPSNGFPNEPLIPGRLVFDLDPAPDTPFSAVIAAAREVRERLADVGLNAFCKTTGGKGLHVVTPLKRERHADWRLAKSFTREICRRMMADAPNAYLITAGKAARVGKIFLDYLRNDLTATTVAPLSTRAHPGAPVSMPLNWSQIRAGLDPGRFTLRTAPALLAKAKPWEEYAAAAEPLTAAAKKLLGQVRPH